LFGILALGASGLVLGQGQSDVDEDGKIIQDAFAARKSALPELGWVLPNGELVTEVSAPEVTILAEKIEPRDAPQLGVIPAAQVVAYVKLNQVDCDRSDEMDLGKLKPLYRYAAKMPVRKWATRVLVLAGRANADMRAGYELYKPSETELKSVWTAMELRPGQKQVIDSLQQNGSKQFFVFAETYSKNRLLYRQGVFLVDHTGLILGQYIEKVNGEAMCDGCGVPLYQKGRTTSYLFQNVISIPELPYPMVLEDSSTVEVRAVDLFTFSTSGQMSLYRKYEYMVTCILGPDSK
jgi:hypothetical protein